MITRTGWTFEYVDDCELRRIIELLEYWGREERGEAAPKEGIEEEQMMGMAAFIGQPGAMTDKMREDIAWAEEMKAKMGHGAN